MGWVWVGVCGCVGGWLGYSSGNGGVGTAIEHAAASVVFCQPYADHSMKLFSTKLS